MAKIIPDEARYLFEKEPLVALATANSRGEPNVAPMFWKTILGEDTLLIIDNYMKRTKENILQNDKVCVSFWNPKTEEAYKLKGTAKYHVSGLVYKEGLRYVQMRKPGIENVRGVVEIKVTDVFNIKPGEKAGERM